MTKSHYSMNTGRDDEYRLKLLNDTYNPYSRKFIQKAPIPVDATILEIGCGAGHQSVWMAKEVVPNGFVIASDASEQQISIAKNTAKLAGVENIKFVTLDIENPHGEFKADLVINRFLLLHLKNPKSAIVAMTKLLNPGGYVISEDVIMSGVIAGPVSEAINQAFFLFSEHFRRQNKNPDMGAELFALYNILDIKDIEVSAIQPILYNAEQKKLMQLSFAAIKKSLLELKLLNQNEFDVINNALIKELDDMNQVYFPGRLVQIRGKSERCAIDLKRMDLNHFCLGWYILVYKLLHQFITDKKIFTHSNRHPRTLAC